MRLPWRCGWKACVLYGESAGTDKRSTAAPAADTSTISKLRSTGCGQLCTRGAATAWLAVAVSSNQQLQQHLAPANIGACPIICIRQIRNVQLTSGSRGTDNGLWGMWFKNGADNLVTNFQIQTRFVRDIALQGLQPGMVINNGECRGHCEVPTVLISVWLCVVV